MEKLSRSEAAVVLIGALLVVGAFLLGVGLVAGLAALQAFILQLLWNFTMPALFGLPVIGFWQMFALMVLVNFVIRRLRASK